MERWESLSQKRGKKPHPISIFLELREEEKKRKKGKIDPTRPSINWIISVDSVFCFVWNPVRPDQLTSLPNTIIDLN